MEQMLNYITTIINGTNAQLYNNYGTNVMEQMLNYTTTIINGTNAQLYYNYN